jgi:predicted nucleic acid-binding protein
VIRDSFVLDSSAIAPVFFPEEKTGLVMAMLENKRFITVDLAYAEVTNVAWKRCMFSHENMKITREALTNCITFITDVCDVLPARDLVMDAFVVAHTHSITVYDALFIAAAQKCKVPLLTLDTKLYHKIKNIENVHLIS